MQVGAASSKYKYQKMNGGVVDVAGAVVAGWWCCFDCLCPRSVQIHIENIISQCITTSWPVCRQPMKNRIGVNIKQSESICITI